MTTINFKGKPIHTSGELPKKGEVARDFLLTAQDLSEVSLDNFPKKKKVLNVFPSLDTATCALSVETFYRKLAGKDSVVLLNISADLPFAQGRFCNAKNLSNAITLSTFRSDFPAEYELLIAEGPLKGLCSRAVIVLDENNCVLYSEQVPEITQEPNYDAALKALGLK